MTMTQKDFEAQEAQFAALKEEFSRLKVIKNRKN